MHASCHRTTETRKKEKIKEKFLTSSKVQNKGKQILIRFAIYSLAPYCHPCIKTAVSYTLGHAGAVMLMSWLVTCTIYLTLTRKRKKPDAQNLKIYAQPTAGTREPQGNVHSEWL